MSDLTVFLLFSLLFFLAVGGFHILSEGVRMRTKLLSETIGYVEIFHKEVMDRLSMIQEAVDEIEEKVFQSEEGEVFLVEDESKALVELRLSMIEDMLAAVIDRLEPVYTPEAINLPVGGSANYEPSRSASREDVLAALRRKLYVG